MGGRAGLLGAAAVVLASVLPARAQQEGPRPPVVGEEVGKDVVLTTSDGMKLAATLWRPALPNGSGAVLLHMYRRDRTSWHPLVDVLRSRGMDVLAVDLRGHGGSAKQGGADLADRVANRDPALFADMHRDAYAAVRYLVLEAKCDAKRIGIAGASVGCSVAIDTVRRHPSEVAAVVCMSPGADYLGLKSIEHAKGFPAKCALLLMSHAEEADVGAKALGAAVKHARLLVYDEKRPSDAEDGWAHGTRMFGRLPLAEQTVASFLAARTGSRTDDVVLDGVVEEEARPGGAWTRATRIPIVGEGHAAWAYRVGPRLVFGGTVPAGMRAVTWTARLPVEFLIDRRINVEDAVVPFDFTIDVETGGLAKLRIERSLEPARLSPGQPARLPRGLPVLRVTRKSSGLEHSFEYEGEIVLGGPETLDASSKDDPPVKVEATRELPDGPPEIGFSDADVPAGVPVSSR